MGVAHSAMCCTSAPSSNSGVTVHVNHDDTPAMLSTEEIVEELSESARETMATRSRQHGALPREENIIPSAFGLPGQHHSSTFSLPRTALNLIVAPGDLLFAPGTGRIANIGVAGGLMGHVLLVLGAPQVVHKHSKEGFELQEFWPDDSVQEIWRMRTLESTRANEGLLESDCLLYVEKVSQKLTFCAEIDLDGNVFRVENEPVEVWQSPPALRQSLRIDLMQEVVQDMIARNAQWSELTAMKAVFTSARIIAEASSQETMNKVLQSWLQRPICTSVIVIFWQRYLCKLAAEHASAESEKNALELIMRWIPLKADCVLPGDLTRVLPEVGWVRIISLPQVFVPLSAPAAVSLIETAKLPEEFTEDEKSAAYYVHAQEDFEESQDDSAAFRGRLKIQKVSEDETSAGGASSDAESVSSLSGFTISDSQAAIPQPSPRMSLVDV